MAGRRRVPKHGAVVLCLLLTSLVACGGRPTATDAAEADVQHVLDLRAAAVLDRDGAAVAETGAASWFQDVSAVPLASWAYKVTGVHRTGATATADAELRYQVQGYDQAPVTVARTLALSLDAAGRWYVKDEKPAKKAPQQLWDQGEVTVVRGRHSIVLGVGQSGERLHAFADLADDAVPAVSDAWGPAWSRHVVVLVPRSLDGMAGLLGSPASSYRGIAAVTTGETGAPAQAPADRIIVNPDAYGLLGNLGRQVVLTHETTHVATRTATTAATPLWLSEGYADWVGYRGSGRTPAEVAPELGEAVSAGRVPKALPSDADFGFGGSASALAMSYEGGWLACRLIADRWGEAKLGEFYRSVGTHRKRPGAVEEAMADVLGTDLASFTTEWRQYLRDQLA
ncbi:hypothetical protein M2163_003384 [Streptomyces sp. SAI-135]|uniref:hypothetical protein n=1 Tax=unclassified Streptomyces TaxID=2593676 RepID=UPI002473C4A8|nr:MULTISPECIES: hypothetical protein [unclassified Streptomyces]MDH6519631.1 hypothetical protein [Streptomyces sp. SAI-090]MDH6616276.1 hypothetical protein [Streptomyces sp. SAI-135]